MNRPGDWRTVARVTDPEREAFWQSVFGTKHVPITSLVPMQVNLPNHPNALAYMLDLRAITPEQYERLVQGLSKRFDLDPEWLDEQIEQHGVPILADDVSILSTDRALFFGTVLAD